MHLVQCTKVQLQEYLVPEKTLRCYFQAKKSAEITIQWSNIKKETHHA